MENIATVLMIYSKTKLCLMMSRILPKVRILSAVHLQTRLFLCPRNQQMVTERQLKAFNEIGLGDFAARVMETR